MATFTATEILTGAVEVPKWIEKCICSEIYNVSLPNTLSTDTITGPTIPANTYLVDVIVDVTDLDTGGPSITFECGYSGHLAAFIADTNTTAGTGGIQHANVAGTVGFTATTDTQVLVTITVAATTPAVGTMRIAALYTASP